MRKESVNLQKSWKEIEKNNESKTSNTVDEGELLKESIKCAEKEE